MKWNRNTDDPRLGTEALTLGPLYRTEPSRDEKRHTFEKFYKGWRDCVEGRAMFAPTGWSEADQHWYHRGYQKAKTVTLKKETPLLGQGSSSRNFGH